MKNINKSLAIGILLAVLTLTTVSGVVLAQTQTNVVPQQQQAWCADGTCDGVCNGNGNGTCDGTCTTGVCQPNANGKRYGCHGTNPPAAK